MVLRWLWVYGALFAVMLTGTDPQAAERPRTYTATDSCVTYGLDTPWGLFFSGKEVSFPERVRWQYRADGSATLWLPGQPALHVVSLNVRPIPPGGCFFVL